MTNRQIPNLPVVKQDETYEKCRHDGVRFVTPDGTKSRCPCGEILNEPFNPTLPPQTFTGVELGEPEPEGVCIISKDSPFEKWWAPFYGTLAARSVIAELAWQASRAELVERVRERLNEDRSISVEALYILNEEAAK